MAAIMKPSPLRRRLRNVTAETIGHSKIVIAGLHHRIQHGSNLKVMFLYTR